MSSLFRRVYLLLRQGQINILEDFLTEIFAEVFEDTDMLISFYNTFAGINLIGPTHIEITTQKTYPKLSNHDTDSRPDLVIQFRDSGNNYLTFFENKFEASEGYQQLNRYSDHLNVFKAKGYHTRLFYVTRYDDVKSNMKITQIRWYMIYNWLKTNSNTFINKVIRFMEEIHLNETRRFLPQDIYAIQNMDRLQKMMDECLDGPVDETMTKLFGRALGWSNRQVQLRDKYRYFKINDQGNWHTRIGCGFYLTEEDYPLVSVMFEVSPTYPERPEAIKAMKWFLKNVATQSIWEAYNLDDSTKWSGICCDVNLLGFLKEDDHINAIQKFFIDKLNSLYLIKQQYSHLNWKV